jgi:hypothetical protein
MSAIVNSTRTELRIDVNVRGEFAKSNFADLAAQRDAIEAELQATLSWEEKPGQKESRISHSLPDTDWTDNADRARQLEWFVKNLALLKKVLAPRVAKIRDPEGDETLAGDEGS